MTSSTETFVLDTHALVWYLTDHRNLSIRAASLIARSEAGDARIVIPTIVLAELLTIVEKQRAPLRMETLLDWMVAHGSVIVESFDLLTFAEMLVISSDLEIHDRIIAATARLYGLPVITRDPELARVVQTIW